MASRRTLVSYDDLSAPQDASAAQLGPPLPSTNQPPAKKRRTYQKAPPKRMPQHWDDPGNAEGAMNYDDNTGNDFLDENAEYEEESRELNHEEIWDDSALIDAWNSATAEYEAYHGKEKKWKTEPVKRSPLWYNVPPSPSKATNVKDSFKTSNVTSPTHDAGSENSKPLNFETYVPTHDPSLASGLQMNPAVEISTGYSQSYLPNSGGVRVSQDEAFEKAMHAMYWSGYWTAMYHCNKRAEAQPNGQAGDDEGEEAEETVGDADMDDDLIETQR